MPEDEPQAISNWVIIATIVGAMMIGSLIRWLALRKSDDETRRDRLASLTTWWALSVIFCLALLGGQVGICGFMFLLSCVAFYEFDSILANTPVSTRLIFGKQRWLFYTLILGNYWLVIVGDANVFFFFLPAIGMIATASLSILRGQTDGYLRETAGRFWGLITLVYFLSFAALIVQDSGSTKTWDDQIGWFVYLVVLTQVNDIAQSIVGKRFGKHRPLKLAPNVSPNKTWQGAIGGLFFTVVVAVILSVPLTNLADRALVVGDLSIEVPYLAAVIAGILISVSGIFGDLNMSGLKRDAKVKDSSRLLPGMGGIIDRVDSLTFTAPVLYFYVVWICQ